MQQGSCSPPKKGKKVFAQGKQCIEFMSQYKYLYSPKVGWPIAFQNNVEAKYYCFSNLCLIWLKLSDKRGLGYVNVPKVLGCIVTQVFPIPLTKNISPSEKIHKFVCAGLRSCILRLLAQ